MAIPCSRPSDVLLVYLLRNNPALIGEWISLKSVAEKLVPFFISKKAPEFVSPPHPSEDIPQILLVSVDNLRKWLYIDFDDKNLTIRLTPLGTFVAFLYDLDLPEGLLDI